MAMVEIVDKNRRPLARVSLTRPGRLDLRVLDESCKPDVVAFVNRAWHEGVPYRTGRQIEVAGKTTIVDELVTVKPGDERFLRALADAVSRRTFGGRRAFGLVKQEVSE